MADHLAILLCAGYGTRMGDLVKTTPKPLLPVAGRPVLDYLLDQVAELDGIGAVHVVTNSRYAGAFRRWADARRADPLPITVHDDGSTSNEDRLGAIGDLGFVLERTGLPEGAFVAAGDNVLRFRLRPFWERFRRGGTSHVLALRETRRERLQKTGVLELEDDVVTRFWEKPAEPPSRWTCPPFYALGRSALTRVAPYLAAGRPADEIGRLVAHLVEHETVRAVRVDGERLDIGSPASYRQADEILRREGVFLDQLRCVED